MHNAEGEIEPLVTWIFEPGTFAPVAKIEGNARYGVVTDHLGTPAMLLTEAGRVAWKAQLDLYGVPREEVRETACPWRYPGQYEDPETGLYYNRFRYYDPEVGRYISPDPMGLLGGLEPYAYVHDPLGWLDPWGLSACRGVNHPRTREASERGMQAHRNYQQAAAAGSHLLYEYRLPSGKRVDAVDLHSRIVRELKPDNPKAIMRGEKQAAAYAKELAQTFGGTWTHLVDTYRP